MEVNEKWIHDYIDGVDLNRIEWLKLNDEQLMQFYEENYWDDVVGQYVCGEAFENWAPFGLNFLPLDLKKARGNLSFLLGVVPNNIGKKTIVSAMTYRERYIIADDQEAPLTYIGTLETNSYFRNKGIYSRLCDVVIDFINPEQSVLISHETELGEKHRVSEKLANALKRKGFTRRVWDDYSARGQDFFDCIRGKSRVLKPQNKIHLSLDEIINLY